MPMRPLRGATSGSSSHLPRVTANPYAVLRGATWSSTPQGLDNGSTYAVEQVRWYRASTVPQSDFTG